MGTGSRSVFEMRKEEEFQVGRRLEAVKVKGDEKRSGRYLRWKGRGIFTPLQRFHGGGGGILWEVQ